MDKLQVRKLLHANPEALFTEMDSATYNVVFDDGEIPMSAFDIILSSFAWFFHRENAKLPLTTDLTITSIAGEKPYSSTISTKLFNKCMRVYLDYNQIDNDSKALVDAVKRVVLMNDYLYNSLTMHLDRFIVAPDITDYVKLSEHPYLKEEKAKLSTSSSQAEVEAAIQRVGDAIVKGLHDENGVELFICELVRSNVIKLSQTVQAAFMRGYVFDINKEIIPYPVLTDLVEGHVHVENFALATKDAGVSIATSERDLGNITYDCLKHGYITASVRKVTLTDCGSKHYILYPVDDELDLLSVVDSYRITESGDVVLITEEDTDLIDTSIKLRNPLYCTNRAKQSVCSTCYGGTHVNIDGEVIGSAINRDMSIKDIQDALSMKHVVSGLTTGGDFASPLLNKYFKYTNILESRYLLAKTPLVKSNKKVKLRILLSEFIGLNILLQSENVNQLALNRTSRIENIVLVLEKKSKTDEIPIQTAGRNACMMTASLLAYIKKTSSKLVYWDSKTVEIDITDYLAQTDTDNINLALFKYPNIVNTPMESVKSMLSIYEASPSKVQNPFAITDVALNIYDIVKKRSGRSRIIKFNIVALSLSAYIARDVRGDGDEIDYGITRAWEKGAFVPKFHPLMMNRSFSTQSQIREQSKRTFDIHSYTDDRPTPVMGLDVFMQPQEVIKSNKYKID
jgi:hypothetical protein